MTATFIDAGSDATNTLLFLDSTFGTVGSSTTEVKTGPRSYSLVAGGAYFDIDRALPSGSAHNGRACMWWYAPSHSTGIDNLILLLNSAGVQYFGVRRRSDGVLSLWDYTTERTVGTHGAISVGWHHLAVAWSYTSSSVNEFRVWLDGVLVITATDVTWTYEPGGGLRIGKGSNNFAGYIDDIYVDDANTLDCLPEIFVTAKLPAADNAGNFDTGIGSGTNRYDRVSERTLSTTNGWQHAAATQVQENYTLQSASAGDVDISSENLLARCAWIYTKRGAIDIPWLHQIGQVQSKGSNHTTTVIPSTTDMSGNGNCIVVVFVCDDDGDPGTTATCADSQGNTYVSAAQGTSGGSGSGVRTAIFVAVNTTALTGSNTITVTHGSVNASAAAAIAFQDIVTSSPIISGGTNIVTNSSDQVTATYSLTESQNDVLCILAFGYEGVTTDGNSLSSTGTSYFSQGGSLIAEVGSSGQAAGSNVTMYSLYFSYDGPLSATWTRTLNSNRDGVVAHALIQGVTGKLGTKQYGIVDNGSAYSFDTTITTLNALKLRVSDSTSYPSNAAGIGMRSSGGSGDSYLYECGTLIAYTLADPVRPKDMLRPFKAANASLPYQRAGF